MALDLYAPEIYQAVKGQVERRFKVGAGVSLFYNRDDLSRLAIAHKEEALNIAQENRAKDLAQVISAENLDLKFSDEKPYSSAKLEFEIMWSMLQKGLATNYDAPELKRIPSLQTYREIFVDSMNAMRKSIASGHRQNENDISDTLLASANKIRARNRRIAEIHKRREDRKRQVMTYSEAEYLTPAYR